MGSPALNLKLFCLPPYRRRQNPVHIWVKVWSTASDAKAHFRSVEDHWERTAVAYFLPFKHPLYPAGPRNKFTGLLGETHFTLRNFSISSVAHEFAHAAEAFASRHGLAEVKHCPYELNNDREECVAYVLGTLVDTLYKRLPPDILKRWLENSLKPLQ